MTVSPSPSDQIVVETPPATLSSQLTRRGFLIRSGGALLVLTPLAMLAQQASARPGAGLPIPGAAWQDQPVLTPATTLDGRAVYVTAGITTDPVTSALRFVGPDAVTDISSGVAGARYFEGQVERPLTALEEGSYVFVVLDATVTPPNALILRRTTWTFPARITAAQGTTLSAELVEPALFDPRQITVTLTPDTALTTGLVTGVGASTLVGQTLFLVADWSSPGSSLELLAALPRVSLA